MVESCNDSFTDVSPSIEERIAKIPYIAKDYQRVFAENIAAFKDYIPDIAEAFRDYQPAQFELVATDFSVDLAIMGTDTLVFGGDAFRTSLMDFEYYKQSPKATNFVVKQSDGENRQNFIHLTYLDELAKLEKVSSKHQSARSFFPDSLGMLICFGLGTGFYLERLLSEHDVNRIYVYEPNHDFFYASLHLIDWRSMLEHIDQRGGSIHLCLGANEDAFFADLGDQLFRKGRYDISKSFIYEHYQDPVIQKALTLFEQKSYELAYGFGFFDDALMAVAHHYHNLDTSSAIENKLPLKENADVPVFICGNGPSLDKNIALIKQYQHQVLVVSCGTTIDTLLRNGILPDFHVEQERTRPVHDRLLSVDKEILKKIPFLSINTISPEVFKLFERRMFALKADEPSTLLTRELGEVGMKIKRVAYCNPTVANCALTLIEALGFREFYFIGTDLGFPSGQHHSKDSVYYDDRGDDRALFDIKGQDTIELEGNFGGTVRSSSAFGYSAQSITAFISRAPHIRCFNLSDGALIKGAQPLEPHQLTISSPSLDKSELVDRCFTHYSLDCRHVSDLFLEKLESLDFEHFINELIAITNEPVTDRFSAIQNLYKQYAYLEGGGVKESLYLRDMIRGSILYTHTILSRMLQSTEDTDIALSYHQQGLEIVRRYLEGMKEKYQHSLLVPDETVMAKEWESQTTFNMSTKDE
ncbi:6-hydroxymethylpterin diphosphokinase MptE-like protein [Motilimonas sp. KMU-193]|uniref:motility associated factor glycosyltransferase family protein n=1 Tax=Motilimonas sp. KMU-193 TaxID=3388668 RepID=UPI00396B2653